MKKTEKRSEDPISCALDIIGDKWSLLIIRDIMMNGKNTYNEFLKSEEKIATNILASRLSMLEETGILAKEEHPESKAKIFYRLTQQGIDLLPVIIELLLWSDKYLTPEGLPAKAYAKILRKDKEAIVKRMLIELKKNNQR